jgi:hypothetical protein
LRIPFSYYQLGIGKLKALSTHTLHKGHHISNYQLSFSFAVNITYLVFITTRSTLNTSQHGLPQIVKSKSSITGGTDSSKSPFRFRKPPQTPLVFSDYHDRPAIRRTSKSSASPESLHGTAHTGMHLLIIVTFERPLN